MVFKTLTSLILITGAILFVYQFIYAKVNIKDRDWEPRIFVYQEWIGDYNKAEELFDPIDQDFESLQIKQKAHVIIHYDDPDKGLNPSKLRSVVGVLIDPSDQALVNGIRSIIQTKHKYKITTLSNITSVTSGKLSHPNFFSKLWLKYLLLPKLWDYGDRNRIFTKENVVAVIHIYHHKSGENKETQIEILIPHGKNVEKLILTNAPKPSYVKVEDL